MESNTKSYTLKKKSFFAALEEILFLARRKYDEGDGLNHTSRKKYFRMELTFNMPRFVP